jgi:hypothetical protein
VEHHLIAGLLVLDLAIALIIVARHFMDELTEFVDSVFRLRAVLRRRGTPRPKGSRGRGRSRTERPSEAARSERR